MLDVLIDGEYCSFRGAVLTLPNSLSGEAPDQCERNIKDETEQLPNLTAFSPSPS